jgi:hypothetical protein
VHIGRKTACTVFLLGSNRSGSRLEGESFEQSAAKWRPARSVWIDGYRGTAGVRDRWAVVEQRISVSVVWAAPDQSIEIMWFVLSATHLARAHVRGLQDVPAVGDGLSCVTSEPHVTVPKSYFGVPRRGAVAATKAQTAD